MTKRFNLAILLLLSLVLTTLNVQAASWIPKAKNLFEEDEYSRCIDLADKYEKDNMATLFLAYSHLQESVFNDTKYDKEKFKLYTTKLEAKLGINDMDNLLYFIGLDDKPVVIKEARKLTKKVFKNITDIEDVPKLLSFLKVNDEDTRKLTITAIYKILKPKRDYVKKGGTLRAKDIKVMKSKALITALLQEVETSTKAAATLALIEEPVLEYINEDMTDKTIKLENKINKEMNKRLTKYPDSNWYSAVGKVR